jgi:hypothetical protein
MPRLLLICYLQVLCATPRSEGERTVHLGGHDSSGEDTATDGDHAGERALLVDVGSLNGGLGGTETQTNVLVPSPAASVLARSADLVVKEDVRLSHRISIGRAVVSRFGHVVPASGKRAPTGHYFAVSSYRTSPEYRITYVSSVAMVAVRVSCRAFDVADTISTLDLLSECGRQVIPCRFLAPR